MSTELTVAPDVGALEADPVAYMAVVLNRAKGWLAEAQSIESVRDQKAIAVGMESVIREKELAFDAQLSATEIVRRCERRIGELVRQGQHEGGIRIDGQRASGPAVQRVVQVGPAEAAGVVHRSEVSPLYAMADAPVEQFEEAITEAREEGNLSRANVVRKVKGESTPAPERSEWHHKKRRIDSNRILTTLAQELDAATSGLDLIEPAELDPETRGEAIASIKRSLTVIGRHVRRVQ